MNHRFLACTAALILVVGSGAQAGLLQKGVSLPLWNENVDTTQLAQSLVNFKAIGGEWVGVNVFWFQDDINSTSIAPDFTKFSASDASVAAAIDAAHARGLKVMLKPLVNLGNDPGHWRGQINGTDPWFDDPGGYRVFMSHWAAIANDKGADLFAVGTELVATAANEAKWRQTIAEVRAIYSGPLVYAANHGGAGQVTQADIAWWDALDYIGLDAYYPLTGVADPTLTELRAAWAARGAMIDAWLAGLDPADQKPVLFTEVGYRSWDGANRDPANQNDKSDNNIDQQEQADCYRALLEQLWGSAPWLEGLYWWNWEVDPHPDWEADNWYPIQDKLAEGVLREFYLETGAIPEPGGWAFMLAGLAALARRSRR